MKMIKKIALVSTIALLTTSSVFASGKKDVKKTAEESTATVKETAEASAEAVKEAAKDAVDETVTAAKNAAEKIERDLTDSK